MTQEMHEPAKELQPIGEMSDREIAEETLYWLRQAGGALVQLQQGGMGGMMKMMMGGKK
jgi:phage/plasmid primase-like uncharacterized protein